MARSSTASGWPNDLALVVLLVALTVPALLLPGVPLPVEWLLGVPFLLVLPGYALVSAQLSGGPDDSAGRATDREGASTTLVVRLALALPASIVVVATIAVLLSATVGIRLEPTVAFVAAVTIVGVLIAAYRRTRRPTHARATPLRDGVAATRRTFGGSTPHTLAIVVALIALASAIAFAGAAGPDHEAYTEFYVLSEDDDGQLVANDFPAAVTAGESLPLHLAIENKEGRQMSYDVVVLGVPDGSGDSVVLDRFEVGVDEDNNVTIKRSIVPRRVGDDTRIEFLLYKGDAPADPDGSAADIALRLLVDVQSAGAA